MKTKEEAVNFIYSRRKFAKSNGLERIEALLALLGKPQRKVNIIHVAGTNGKGSVSTMMSCVLKQAGYRTGLFTSPFVLDFLERIQIDNEFADEKVFVDATNKVADCVFIIEKENLCPTFFEVVLAVALVCFEKSGCDFAVLEAGIGGRDDSTNVISAPELAVIMSISKDHTDVLGDSITSIAEHKCGIIKKGSSVVSFPKDSGKLDFVPQHKDAVSVIENACKNEGCKLIFPSCGFVQTKPGDYGQRFIYKGLDINISFSGEHQVANATVAIEAMFELKNRGFSISDECIQKGLENSFIAGRMEKLLYKEKTVILDGGHNPGCMTALYNMLKKTETTPTAVLGFMADKDYKTAIGIISPVCKKIIFTLADAHRGETAENLLSSARDYTNDAEAVENCVSAFEKACSEDDTILVAGSFYLVSEIRKYIKEADEREKND